MSAVPAWKRLGLKLKGAPSDGSPVSASPQTTTASAPPATRHQHQQPNLTGGSQNATPGFNKRKQFGSGSSFPISESKRPRWDESSSTPTRKSVAFSQDTKKAAPKKPKKKKKAPKQQSAKEPFDFTPVVQYLRSWHKARDSWKFNKNHQTLLIKNLYNSDAIPSTDIDSFYMYISDIKGASRKRLVEEAQEVRKKDMATGSGGFPEGTKVPEEKQKQYKEILAELLRQKAEIRSGAGSAGGGKRSFDEADFVMRDVDEAVQQRVVKRMRAETVIEELESSDSGGASNLSSSASTNAASSRATFPTIDGDATAANSGDAPKQKAKRRKKLRTADVDSSSESESSDSDSDADSSTGSSSSSSESDSDEEMATANGVEDAASSSSSSSSSESDSDSESEGPAGGAAVTEDDDSGSDGDSESSDSESQDDA